MLSYLLLTFFLSCWGCWEDSLKLSSFSLILTFTFPFLFVIYFLSYFAPNCHEMTIVNRYTSSLNVRNSNLACLSPQIMSYPQVYLYKSINFQWSILSTLCKLHIYFLSNRPKYTIHVMMYMPFYCHWFIKFVYRWHYVSFYMENNLYVCRCLVTTYLANISGAILSIILC